jgi:PleD family two-component response regulator
MDDMTKEVQDLKNSLQFLHGQLDEFKQNGKITTVCKSLREDISSVCESMITMTEKSDYVEGQSSWNNGVEDGIAEFPGQTWTESEDKLREMILEKLKMDHRKI